MFLRWKEDLEYRDVLFRRRLGIARIRFTGDEMVEMFCFKTYSYGFLGVLADQYIAKMHFGPFDQWRLRSCWLICSENLVFLNRHPNKRSLSQVWRLLEAEEEGWKLAHPLIQVKNLPHVSWKLVLFVCERSSLLNWQILSNISCSALEFHEPS